MKKYNYIKDNSLEKNQIDKGLHLALHFHLAPNDVKPPDSKTILTDKAINIDVR